VCLAPGIGREISQDKERPAGMMAWTAPPRSRRRRDHSRLRPQFEGGDMPNPAVIGLDIAKNVFQVHGADAEGRYDLPPGKWTPGYAVFRSACSGVI
ncbi:MAG TPA: hypothetical protein VGC56_17995, partial [Allosphingosinicella sp.]